MLVKINLEEVNLVCFLVGCAQDSPQRGPEGWLLVMPVGTPEVSWIQCPSPNHAELNRIDPPETAFRLGPSQMPWLLTCSSQSF